MKIAVIDKLKFEKKSGEHGTSFGDNRFEVISIVIKDTKIHYITSIGEQYYPRIYQSELFTVIDSTIPDNWHYKYYGHKNKIKNSNYDFKIEIDAIMGPKELVESDTLMFDIYENPNDFAYELYKITHKNME